MPDVFDKEVCDIKYSTIRGEIKALEVRIFEILKKSGEVSDIKHEGHKKSLRTSIISVQKDVDSLKSLVSSLEKLKEKMTVHNLNAAVHEEKFKIEQTKLTKVTYCVYGVMVVIFVYILTKGNYTKTVDFILKFIGG